MSDDDALIQSARALAKEAGRFAGSLLAAVSRQAESLPGSPAHAKAIADARRLSRELTLLPGIAPELAVLSVARESTQVIALLCEQLGFTATAYLDAVGFRVPAESEPPA